MASLVDTHLFCVVPNHSGSSFLRTALETSNATWNLRFDGPWLRGYIGPSLKPRPGVLPQGKVWAADPRLVAQVADPALHDWRRTRRAWYFQAHAWQPKASVFVEKSTLSPAQVQMRDDSFRNAKFVFSVRNPYAVSEGICRTFRHRFPELTNAAAWGRPFEEVVALHVVNVLRMQARNLDEFGGRGVFFTYEELCAAPERMAGRIRALVPALDDLNLGQRLSVKQYDEKLVDMNARQIARLEAEQITLLNGVFDQSRDVIERFGYEVTDTPAASFADGAGARR